VGSMRAVIHVSGTVVPADGAEFLAVAPEPARVIDVTKNQGDAVAAGEVVVRFELPGATQEVARQQADLARAQAELENVRVTRDRVADFVTRGLVARNDLNQADRDLADAQAAVTGSAAALRRAQDALARASVRTPFAGIVANRLHNPGDIAQGVVTDPVLRVVDPARLEVLASVPGADASRVLPGAPARLAGTVDGQPVQLSVAGRATGQPDGAGNLRVRLTFVTPTQIMVDSVVELDIDAEERTNVVFVPASALVSTGKDAALFVVMGDQARRRAVVTGVTTDRGVEITAGLNAGELVITRGQDNVTDGARISAEVVR
ncbi:MAG: efflux RND transporter periplasmic adaptor subunit, partial [Vicinamibacterales bacterium]